MTDSSEQAFINALDQLRGRIESNAGGWFPGEAVYSHGYSLLDELVGEKSYFQNFMLCATGKMISPELGQWLEAIFGCMSYPDHRIWCNQIGALAGCTRTSPVAATVAGILAADSRTYGSYPIVESVRFIQSALAQKKAGLSVAAIVEGATAGKRGKPYITGFIRPIAKGDERLEVMEALSARLGFAEGEHLRLAYEIEKVMLEKYDQGININGYIAAFLADQNFSPQEAYQMSTLVVAAGVMACFLDTRKKPAETFLPLRCDDIEYQGAPAREVPEA